MAVWQVDTANMVSSHQLQEQSTKYQQEIQDLKARLAALTQKNEDLTVQLQVYMCVSHRYLPHTSTFLYTT
jgi:cell division protein FtsB